MFNLSRRIFFAVSMALLGLATTHAMAADPKNVMVVETNLGTFKIEMLPELAPKHVARIKELVNKKFYDGIVFHRVIEGFMAQTGDPTGTGTSGSGVKIPAEFSRAPFERGTVGMARSSDPNSADSQWFICFAASPFLNGQYTVWGRVIEGMALVDKIKRGHPQSGAVSGTPDKMVKVYMMAN